MWLDKRAAAGASSSESTPGSGGGAGRDRGVLKVVLDSPEGERKVPRLQKNGISEISPLATDLGRRQNRLAHWKLALELEIGPQGLFGLGCTKIPNGSAGGPETKIRFCIYRHYRS